MKLDYYEESPEASVFRFQRCVTNRAALSGGRQLQGELLERRSRYE